MFLVFDTETTGLPKNFKAPVSDSDNWPRMVQLAWQLHDKSGKLLEAKNYIIRPEGYDIPIGISKIHGITTERAERDGVDLTFVLEEFNKDISRTTYNVGHNIEFDINIVGAELFRKGITSDLAQKDTIDTKNISVDFCAIPGGRGGGYKWPTLTELHQKLFGKGFGDAHDAAYDVDATARCFFGLITNGTHVPKEITSIDQVIYEAPDLGEANFVDKEKKKASQKVASRVSAELKDVSFSHLHCHSQFSILQSTSSVGQIVERAKELNMDAIAMTDHGNMMGTFHFVRDAFKAGIKPIVGCEFNLCDDRLDKSRKNDGFQTVLLAKNKNGYENLIKLASLANTEGFYYVPRIDKKLLLEYKEDLIALTGGIWGEIPNKILFEGEKNAEEALEWWKTHFGDDFYVEINRHGFEEEDEINEILLKLARKHEIKIVACNNSYYTLQKDAHEQDVLLCIRDGKFVSQPKKYIGSRGREFRWGFPNDEFYIKSSDEMKKIFHDLPEAIIHTQEIVDKVESFELQRDVLLPKFDIPEEFQDPRDEEDSSLKLGENNYLRHITYEGAKKRYNEITDEIRERLDFELDVIRNTGYPGYFLIVEDFIREARNMGVSVGPGRGSAAGSVVAYCTWITNIDPIKYDLLFERFLNPERVSMPDIDIDFDDEGRQLVLDYVIDKYGASQVAQIITYGTMAAKSSIRDTARVLELPLDEAGRLAGLVPNTKLKKIFSYSDEELEEKLNADDVEKARQLIQISKGKDLQAKTINIARKIEGTMRNTGIHACGVIITPDEISKFVPTALAKDSDMMCTQFDNSVAEDAGLLKMDFLGLKTLTLIKDSLKIVKARHGIEIDIEAIPIDDEETYELFQRGETVGIFQYESPGMQKHLQSLKPTQFSDLIAMNALYRPGPMEYIPSFVARKHGKETINYDLEGMDEYLEETYGITVYQEQVMLLSQKLSGFSKGEADTLRKAMGKKKLDLLATLKPKFLDQGADNGHKRSTLEKVWKDWEAFASYAFNKSHSTCYAWIAYQTAYLKAHYPAEYMAATLSNNMRDIKDITFFMEEAKRMGLAVLGPDVNESFYKFSVNPKGEIRFGIGAMKGVGEGAVDAIVSQRKEAGNYSSLFDLVKRIDLRAANKKAFESLALGGAFDSFSNVKREQLFVEDGSGIFLEKLLKYGNKYQADQDSSQVSLFDMAEGDGLEMAEPPLPKCKPWGNIERLNKERDVVGIFISGHPLDDFKFELNHFCSKGNLNLLKHKEKLVNKELGLAGVIGSVQHRISQKGNPWGEFVLEDYYNSTTFRLFGEDYAKFKPFIEPGWFIYVGGTTVERKNRQTKETEYQFRINKIELLTDVRKRAKGIEIHFPLDVLEDKFLQQMSELTSEFPGDCQLKFQLNDPDEGAIALTSRSKKVDLSNEFISIIEKIPLVKYRILTKV